MKKLLLSMFCCITFLFSQNIYLDKNHNKFSVDIKYNNYSSKQHKVSLSAGYTLKGRLTTKIMYSYYNTSDILPLGDYFATSIGGEIDYLVIKQLNSNPPLNLSLNASYNYGTLPSESTIENIDEIIFGAEISRVIELSSMFKLTPILGGYWITQIWLPPGVRGIRGSGHFECNLQTSLSYKMLNIIPSLSYFIVTPETTRLPLSKIYLGINIGVII